MGVVLAGGTAAGQGQPAPAALPESVLDVPGRFTPVSAYGGFSAWSRYDGERRRYRLVVRDPQGAIREAPVRSRRVPFDVDLGPDGRGRPTAVYSRCRREPRLGRVPTPQAEWPTARGCRVYEWKVAGGAERGVGVPGRRSAYLPSIWRTRIAYASHSRRRGALASLFVLDRSRRRARRLVGGPGVGRGPDGIFRDPGPVALDLRGKALAFGWRYIGTDCPKNRPSSAGDRAEEEVYSEIRVSRPARARSERLSRACLTTLPSLVTLAGWSGSRVLFTQTDFIGGPGFENRLVSSAADGARRRTEGAVGGRGNVASVSADGRRVLIERQDYEGQDFVDRITEARLP